MLKKRKETIKLSNSQKTKIVRHKETWIIGIGGDKGLSFYKERLTDNRW